MGTDVQIMVLGYFTLASASIYDVPILWSKFQDPHSSDRHSSASVYCLSELCGSFLFCSVFDGTCSDTTLLVPEHTDTELEVEFNHIKAWAAANCMLTFKSEQDKGNGFQAAKDYIFSSTACCR